MSEIWTPGDQILAFGIFTDQNSLVFPPNGELDGFAYEIQLKSITLSASARIDLFMSANGTDYLDAYDVMVFGTNPSTSGTSASWRGFRTGTPATYAQTSYGGMTSLDHLDIDVNASNGRVKWSSGSGLDPTDTNDPDRKDFYHLGSAALSTDQPIKKVKLQCSSGGVAMRYCA